MLLKQISVFVENRHGAIRDIAGVLANAGINIRAMSIADTADFGIVRLIVDKRKEALSALRENGMTVKETDVLALSVPDSPGAMYEALTALAAPTVNSYKRLVPHYEAPVKLAYSALKLVELLLADTTCYGNVTSLEHISNLLENSLLENWDHSGDSNCELVASDRSVTAECAIGITDQYTVFLKLVYCFISPVIGGNIGKRTLCKHRNRK